MVVEIEESVFIGSGGIKLRWSGDDPQNGVVAVAPPTTPYRLIAHAIKQLAEEKNISYGTFPFNEGIPVLKVVSA